MLRRQLIKAMAAAPLAAMLPMSGRLFAAPSTGSKLLLVFLRGGYDAANLLVPVSSSFYYEVRPNIAVAKPGSGSEAALPIDADWGLHPALRDSLYPMLQKGQVAFVPFAGTDDLSRSHFETQDSIELGQSLDGRRNFQSGFMNRLVTALNGGGSSGTTAARPIAFTDQLPLVFRGGTEIPNMAVRNIAKPAVDARQQAIIADMYRSTPLATRVNDGFGVSKDIMQQFSREMDAASRNAINTRGFELEARRVARLMNEKFNLGFIDVGGWDTHVGQGAAGGYLAGRLAELGRGLAAFADESGANWRDTVVVVVSEFGRTFRENGNRGTDHGHGTVYWVLGGSLKGGRVVGEQVRIDKPTLFQDRDYPVINEYRALLGGMFGDVFGLSPARLDAVFTGVRPRSLQLV